MKTIVHCKINGKKLRLTNNSIEIEDSFLQMELVKSLIECKSITPLGESSLPLFFNKYLRKYHISEVVFSEDGSNLILEPNFEETFIDDMLEVIAA